MRLTMPAVFLQFKPILELFFVFFRMIIHSAALGAFQPDNPIL